MRARAAKAKKEKQKRLTFPTMHGILGMDVIARTGHILEPRFPTHGQNLATVKLGRRMLYLRHFELLKRSLVSDNAKVERIR